ncbi:TPA: DNA recombination protein RmuC [Candidatus Saccharibacteria bacterium]|nr:DNA recombination protein RmuC [Candidatus Saccharibacteria bacterium]HIO87563.1 DNA recombination protein RmuC [Candidatus Saccharibacteria bacterium]
MDLNFIVSLIGGLMIGLLVASLWLRKPQTGTNNENQNDSQLRLLQDQIAKLTDKMDTRLDKSNTMLLNSFGKFQTETNQIVKDVTQRLTKLDETNKRVVDVADELKTLQNVLQNPKQRGVLGEYYLQTVLENVLPPGRFAMQYKFADGEIVDAAIFLQDSKILPVDSKFSLENYNRLIDEKDKTKRDALTKLIKNDLKKRIDETAKYIRPQENTMDFAFMFLPSEAMYYDLLIANVGVVSRDLIEYAFQEKKVIIVSPTSFLAYLQTVLQGLRSLQIEEQAKEIQKNVGKLGRHLEVYDEFMGKLGSSLGTTVNHYNRAHKELKKVDKDVTKITGATEVVDPLQLDKPQGDD